jgi:hypothetical protein
MSLHIPLSASSAQPPSSSGSDTDSDSDQEWDDWVSDSADAQRCQSLFEPDKSFPTVEETLKFEKDVKGFDLETFCAALGKLNFNPSYIESSCKLGLDVYGRMRLVNFIRRTVSLLYDFCLRSVFLQCIRHPLSMMF